MKKRTAALLLILLFVLNILADTTTDIHTSVNDQKTDQIAVHQTDGTAGTIYDQMLDGPQVAAVQQRSLTAGLFLNTLGKRNNASFVRNVICKVLAAFFLALFSVFGKSYMAVLLLCMTFLGIWMTAINILHQTDGKKRMKVCLEV